MYTFIRLMNESNILFLTINNRFFQGEQIFINKGFHAFHTWCILLVSHGLIIVSFSFFYPVLLLMHQ